MPEAIKIGFVGTGGIANHHLGNLSQIEGVEIVALCDVVEERAKATAEKFGGRGYTDYHRMIDKEELDGMYVCIPPFAHTDAEILAVEKGFHLFVEKPVVLELETGIKISEAVKKAGVISSVGYGSRYSNAADAAKKFLSERTIGMVACERWGGVPGGPEHWWRVMAKSGGMLHEMATHQVDLIRFLAGDIVEVYKKDALRVNTDLENFTVPDSEIVTMVFSSGAIGYITTCCAFTEGGGSGRMDFVLDGHIMLRYSRGGLGIIPEGAATIEVEDKPMFSIDEAFIHAIKTGDASVVRSPYPDALKSAAVSIAANQSAQEGRPIKVPVTE